MSTNPTGSIDEMLARSGGNATAAGVEFQAQLGAAFASRMLAERQIDSRLDLGDARVQSVRFETEAPVDDILIRTSHGGYVFVQAKRTLSRSNRPESELGKTAEQIVRLWLSCRGGTGERGWDRPLHPDVDRVVIAVGHNSPRTIAPNLAEALNAMHAASSAPLPRDQRAALDTFSELIRQAWTQIEGVPPDPDVIQSILRHVTILPFDLEGPDRNAAKETLAHVLQAPDDAGAAFTVLIDSSLELMRDRLGSDASRFRRALSAANIALLAPPSFLSDVTRLRRYSEGVQKHLDQYEETKVGDEQVKIDRPCTQAVVNAALEGSLLIVGEPGAGKSAVVSAAAGRLRDDGYDVIELAVDRLPVESPEGLRAELGISHSFEDVLTNWPGDQRAFLFIDALDATRGGMSEAVFRNLMSNVLNLPDGRWHVVASIRTFDLRLGTTFRELFKGTVPAGSFADAAFSNVRHVHVPPWSEDEFHDLLSRAPRVATALTAGGKRLRDLARVPFNTRLLADLISGGLQHFPVNLNRKDSQSVRDERVCRY